MASSLSPRLILVGGGARSGKSRYALERSMSIAGTRAFIATAQAFDDEMTQRIAKHREERGETFVTIEEPVDLARAVASPFDVIVVDCLTLWLSNILLGGRDVMKDFSTLEASLKETKGTVILVTNEVGCGIVPENKLAREFRDYAGVLNSRIATIADEVYWMVFGQALRVK